MNAQQMRHLEERIDRAHSAAVKAVEPFPVPKEVKAAELLIKKHEENRTAYGKTKRAAIDRATRDCREKILFGAPDDALKAVKQLAKDIAK